jgi:hypothetical protein
MIQRAIEQRMELWSDDNLSEFGIKVNSGFVANTSNNAKLVKMIDWSLYKAGYDFDWNYTLSQWVIHYLLNKYATLTKYKSEEKEISTHPKETGSASLTYMRDIKPKLRNKRAPKRGLKCHFCNLKYCLEEERKDHEEFWHRNKLVMTKWQIGILG